LSNLQSSCFCLFQSSSVSPSASFRNREKHRSSGDYSSESKKQKTEEKELASTRYVSEHKCSLYCIGPPFSGLQFGFLGIAILIFGRWHPGFLQPECKCCHFPINFQEVKTQREKVKVRRRRRENGVVSTCRSQGSPALLHTILYGVFDTK